MRRVLFRWRGVTVHSYPAMLYLGVVAGVLGGTAAASRAGLEPLKTFAAMILLVLPALVGARLLFVASHWDLYRDDWWRIWRRSEGGAAQYGGLVLAFVVSLPLLSGLGLAIGAFWDAATLSLLIGMVFTRVGCLLNGCCAGRPSEGRWALDLPNARGVWCRRLPTQLWEGGLAAGLLLVSVRVWDRLPFAGALFLANLAAYGVGRLGLELTRESSDRVGPVRLHQAISASLVVIALGAFLVLGRLGPEAPVVGRGPDGNGWYVLLAPPAVLAVLALFRFVGCDEVLGLDSVVPDTSYPATVRGETNGTSSGVLVAYWRLQEQAATTMVPGGTAKEENANYNGFYNEPPSPLNPDTGHMSPPADPILLELGVTPSLLETDPDATAIRLQGGFISVPWSDALNPSQFTLEALVEPEWDLQAAGARGRYYCVIESSDTPATSPAGQKKRLGYAIYAGPDDPNDPTAPYRWQLWVGDGTQFTQLKETLPYAHNGNNPGPLVESVPTYLAVTFDGSAFTLFIYNAGRDIDYVKYALDPVPYAPNNVPPGGDLTIGITGDRRALVGTFPGPNHPLYPFSGKIEEVAVYNAALIEERIISHIGACFKNL